MANLKVLKTRIESVKSTRKITKAMQMVAAAKLRRAQESAEAARPYGERMAAVMGNLAGAAAGSETAPKLLAGTGADQVHLLVVATSERGLCGGFNSSIVKMAKAHANRLVAAGKTVKILTIGKKGREQMKRDYGDMMITHVDMTEVKRVGYSDAVGVARDVLARFEGAEFDVATIFYNKFKSVMEQIPTTRQLIPAEVETVEGADAPFYEYEPDEDEILAELLPTAMTTLIFTALLENAASEQ
ncbi:MAG: F-type H+-transporting ATPase subunit gamma, partial [Paracoccaceae bacterium]